MDYKLNQAPKEGEKRCPVCTKAQLEEIKIGARHGLIELDENNQPTTKSFIPLSVTKCPNCGAIMLFDTSTKK